MKHAVIYCRVSTNQQASEGVSLEAQEAKAKAWCELHDYHCRGIYIDAGISGKRTDNRPELQNALAACEKGDALVFYSLSRLARSTKDTLTLAEHLKAKGCDLVSVSEKIDTTSAAGEMIFTMLAAMAQFERKQIAERTSVALQHKKANDELVGRVPFGFEVQLIDGRKKLVKNANEQAVIKLASQLRKKGHSLHKIVSILEQKGFQPRGKKWYAKSIARVIHSRLDDASTLSQPI
jgi:DNA invertase Pin-like site-specific DNA recombinase